MTIVVIIAVSLVSTLAIFLIKKNRKNLINTQQKTGLISILKLLNLIAHIQKHRGLNAACIGGDNKAQTQLISLKALVSELISKIHNEQIVTDERWVAFLDHWSRLLEHNEQLTIVNSFEQHTRMIRNLIYLIEDLAEYSHLVSDYLPELPQIGYTWRELVSAIESIGQSRAIGSGVTAKSYCSSVEKIQLSFLSESMTNITSNTLRKLSFLPNEKEEHEKLILNATNKMNELNTIIYNNLIHAQIITVNSEEYFELATDVMEQLNTIFIHQTKQVEQLLN